MTNYIKKLVILGFGCVFFMAAAVIYSLLYNEGRCVYPMDTYVFQTKDIPMLLAGVITAVYVIYLVVSVFSFVKFQKRDSSHTRTISPKLGFLGFFGFLGFLGIWTYTEKEMIAPFMFFIFFGFFGFFFEGKLSDTLKDELYLENRKNAELKAYRTGFVLLFFVIRAMGVGIFTSVKACAAFMLISISLIYAFVLFYSNYLLYRFEKEE